MTAPTDLWTQAYMEFTLDMHRHRARPSYVLCWIAHPYARYGTICDFGYLLGESV